MLRRSWTTIDLRTIAKNYQLYQNSILPTQKIMAVVKADGYGHGAIEVSKIVQSLGCMSFAVSNISEAIQLRQAGIKGTILILGYTPTCCSNELLEYDITQTLISAEYAETLRGYGIKAQFAIDTGMNRIGLDADDVDFCEKKIRDFSKDFKISGLFTHLCAADTKSEIQFTEKQINKFIQVCDSVNDLNFEYIHCMNTAGGLFCHPFGNVVRLGISLYGLKPDYNNVLPDGIKPAMEWKSVISMIKSVHPGETIGYGRSFSVKKEMKIATIPTGYADGYSRALSNKGHVIINNQDAPIVGKICMDQLMVDVTNLHTNCEDEVTLIGSSYTADDMAHEIGTIGYEVICGISKRVEREYVT